MKTFPNVHILCLPEEGSTRMLSFVPIIKHDEHMQYLSGIGTIFGMCEALSPILLK